MNLEIAMNNAFHANEFNGFEGYEAAAVMLTAEEFDEELCRDVAMDLSWVDDEPYEDDDAYADGQALASAGWGTGEDYGSAEDVY